MARMFKLAMASAIKSRTQAIDHLKSLLVSADPAPRCAWSYPPFSWEEFGGVFLGLMACSGPKRNGVLRDASDSRRRWIRR